MTIEFKHNGIIKIGFQTTGAPKTIGSLILKIAGKTHTFPIAFKRFTLERIHIITNCDYILYMFLIFIWIYLDLIPNCMGNLDGRYGC